MIKAIDFSTIVLYVVVLKIENKQERLKNISKNSKEKDLQVKGKIRIIDVNGIDLVGNFFYVEGNPNLNVGV